jgi:alpha-aminoadipic semialdehyde synthase
MPNIIGIRREDRNPWERRVPLIPSHIRELIKGHGLRVLIQPSSIRVFADEDFNLEGAEVQDSLAPASVILGIKEIPAAFFEYGKTYIFFSHTIKGQPGNMPMLKALVERKASLIDYERIVDEKGRRLVFFGRQAGAAGLIDSLWALGRRLKTEGIDNPFAAVRQTIYYQSLVEAKEEIAEIGEGIRRKGLAPAVMPFICGFMGYGHVSQGAQEIFDLLPSDEIDPLEFDEFLRRGAFSPHRVYKIVFREEHLVRPRDPAAAFDLQAYYDHPEGFEPVLEKYLPHLVMLINGVYWAPRYPHFVTKKFLRTLYGGATPPRLKVIGDISCDVGGAIECTIKDTDPRDPVYVYDPTADAAVPGVRGNGPVVMAVYNLPAEIPLESSVFFSQSLKPFMPALARADFGGSFESCELPPPIRKAVILFKGEFTPAYRYMADFLK